jgi:hypothetical protein
VKTMYCAEKQAQGPCRGLVCAGDANKMRARSCGIECFLMASMEYSSVWMIFDSGPVMKDVFKS